MIADEILKHIQAKLKFGTHGSDARIISVFSKIKERLGFEPAYSVPDGIEELIASFKNWSMLILLIIQ